MSEQTALRTKIAISSAGWCCDTYILCVGHLSQETHAIMNSQAQNLLQTGSFFGGYLQLPRTIINVEAPATRRVEKRKEEFADLDVDGC